MAAFCGSGGLTNPFNRSPECVFDAWLDPKKALKWRLVVDGLTR